MLHQTSGPEASTGEIEELRARLAEAEETLNAIRAGEVDAVLVTGLTGDKVFTLEGADHTYRRLIEEMSEGAVVLTTAGDILYCNRCFAEFVGLPLKIVLGDSIRRFFAEADQKTLQSLLENAQEDRSTAELTLHTSDGKGVPAHLSATALTLADVVSICLVVTDLTELKRSQNLVADSMKRLEEEQVKANKLESLGLLAGGLAHDLNNSLTAILGNISLAKKLVGSAGEIDRRLHEAEVACLQARDVTEQLLTFSRGGAPVKEAASIAPLLKDWISFSLSGSNVQWDLELDPELMYVEIDKGQISRVINNLIINAQQAMPGGGKIIVRASNVTLGPSVIENVLPLPHGEYVRIEIRDTGMGIPEAHLARIFDPYFTTKQQGSGLGLSVAYSIVKGHDGYLTAASEIGVGTTFQIYLPASSNVPAESPTLPEAHHQKRLRVLVMDDNEAVREVIFDILSNLEDHQVEFADDGRQAIDRYSEARKAGNPFDVVLMDLTIPGGIGGKEAVTTLLEIDPKAKAIVVSGYANDPIMAQYQEYGFKGVIRKPFEIEDLLDTVRAVADAPQ